MLELLLSLYHPDVEQPPSYTDVIDDKPPSYAEVNLAAFNCALIDTQLSLGRKILGGYPGTKAKLDWQDNSSLLNPMPVPSVDFEKTSNLREVANKKAKKAAKAANQARWGDSGDEGNKDGGDGEENGDHGGGNNNGAGGAGGAGGDGGDGGGDDEWNDWNAPKKKKGKKGKGGLDEEEEKRKKEEEEEKRKQEEEKKQEEAANSSTLPWANGGDANPNDEWGVSTTTNKAGKKNKKGKVCLTVDPPHIYGKQNNIAINMLGPHGFCIRYLQFVAN